MLRRCVCALGLLTACDSGPETHEPLRCPFLHTDATLAELEPLGIEVRWDDGATGNGMEGHSLEVSMLVQQPPHGSHSCVRLGAEFGGTLDGVPLSVRTHGRHDGSMDCATFCALPQLGLDAIRSPPTELARLEVDDGTRPIVVELANLFVPRTLEPLEPPVAEYARGQDVVLSYAPAEDLALGEPRVGVDFDDGGLGWFEGASLSPETGTIQLHIPADFPFFSNVEGFIVIVGDPVPSLCTGVAECRILAFLGAYMPVTIQ